MPNDPIRIFCGADRSQHLPFLVLADSIRRHTDRLVQIRTIDNGDAPPTRDPRSAPYTEFSFARFAIPALCEYRGHAIYMDSDMLVFADIGELWDSQMGDAAVGIEQGSRSQAAGGGKSPNRHAAVMLLDCARLDWDVAAIIERLGRDFDYGALMALDPVLAPGQMREAFPAGWNDLDTYDPQRTRNLHFTEIKTQPWVNARHPHGALWVQALKRMLEDGSLEPDSVREEVALGYVRPSLLVELGLEPGADASSPDALAQYDAAQGYVAHKRLLERFAQRKRAIARHGAEQASGLDGAWKRLAYKLRYGSSD